MNEKHSPVFVKLPKSGTVVIISEILLDDTDRFRVEYICEKSVNEEDRSDLDKEVNEFVLEMLEERKEEC